MGDDEDDYRPDWYCTACGSSGLNEDGPPVCDCPTD